MSDISAGNAVQGWYEIPTDYDDQTAFPEYFKLLEYKKRIISQKPLNPFIDMWKKSSLLIKILIVLLVLAILAAIIFIVIKIVLPLLGIPIGLF